MNTQYSMNTSLSMLRILLVNILLGGKSWGPFQELALSFEMKIHFMVLLCDKLFQSFLQCQ